MNYQMLRRNPAFQRDMQKVNSIEPWSDTKTTPGQVAGVHAERLGRTQVEGQSHQNRIDSENKRLELGQKELAFTKDITRQELNLRKDAFNRQKRQNRTANWINAANIGLQGISGILKIQDADTRTKLLNEQAKYYRNSGDMDNYYGTMFMSEMLKEDTSKPRYITEGLRRT